MRKGVILMDMTEKQKFKEENEKKKAFLRSYLCAVRIVNRIQEEIQEVRTMRMSISVNNDGMPHGGGQSDLSDYAATLDKMERQLEAERYNRIRLYLDIKARIGQIKNSNEQDVLFYRYIKGLDWWEIAEKMNYSERQIHRIHGNALAYFQIPKDVSECQ